MKRDAILAAFNDDPAPDHRPDDQDVRPATNGHINYARIKELAKQFKCKATDLIALAPQNDPFYMGVPAAIQKAEWFRRVWEKGGWTQTHPHRIHYWCTTQEGLTLPNGMPYENTRLCDQFVTEAAKCARYRGVVDMEDILDRKHPDPHLFAKYVNDPAVVDVSMPDLSRPDILIYGFDTQDYQPYHLEVIIEKSTMNDVLLPICAEFHANLVTSEGELSITAAHHCVRRIQEADRPTRLIHLTDYDPAGGSMPVAYARKMEFICYREGLDLDIKLHRLLLTKKQVIQYKLPRVPLKKGERRGRDEYGSGTTELDALEAIHPGLLGEMLRRTLAPYYSIEKQIEVEERERELRHATSGRVDEVTARYAEHIQALKAMKEELDQIDVEDDFEEIFIAPADADDHQIDWLYDSKRSSDPLFQYLMQNDRYREEKGKDSIILSRFIGRPFRGEDYYGENDYEDLKGK